MIVWQSFGELHWLAAASAIFEEIYLSEASVKFSEGAVADLIRIQVFPASCTSLEE